MTTAPKPASRRTRGFRQTGSFVATTIRKVTEKRGFAETRLLTDWETICGPDLAAFTTPIRVSYAQDGIGATLTIACKSARAPEVSLQKELIRARVNACYGYNAIARVRITQTSTANSGFREEKAHFTPKAAKTAPPGMTETLKPIEDPGLRAALDRLSKNVHCRNSDGSQKKET